MTAVLGYNSRTIKCTLWKCTVQWLLVYLWNGTASITNFRKRSPLLKWWNFAATPPPFSHPPNPWKSLIFFPFMGWPILEILSLLVYSTQHSVFQAHPCCNLCYYFISLYGQVIFLSMDRPHLLIHSPVLVFWVFPSFDFNAAMNICVWVFAWTHFFFSSLECIPRIRTVESNWW